MILCFIMIIEKSIPLEKEDIKKNNKYLYIEFYIYALPKRMLLHLLRLFITDLSIADSI